MKSNSCVLTRVREAMILIALLTGSTAAFSQSPPPLGEAGAFGVLAGSTIEQRRRVRGGTERPVAARRDARARLALGPRGARDPAPAAL